MTQQDALRLKGGKQDLDRDWTMILFYALFFIIMVCSALLIYALVWLYGMAHAGILADPPHSAMLN